MTHDVVQIKLSIVDPNPFRRLEKFPYDNAKINALRQSIRDVGLWPGVIGRRFGNRVQIAFGHHRVESARRENLQKASLILMDLTDEQMLQYMGRENLEDYNAHFLTMLETWEAGIMYFNAEPRRKWEPIENAKLLGWVSAGRPGPAMNHTARACNHASQLIKGGHLSQDRLQGLSVDSAEQLCGSIVAQHRALEEMAKKTGRPAAEIVDAKRVVSQAGSRVADALRKGEVAPRDIRSTVELESYRHAKEAKRHTPLFAKFGNDIADRIGTMLKTDTTADKLQEIKDALGQIETQDDLEVVDRIAFECKHLTRRADKWFTVFADPKKRVVALKRIEGAKA